MSNILLTQYNQSTLTLTLNRPAVGNALNNELINALIIELEKAADDPAIRVICLTGAGKVFCSGGDLAWMKHIANAPMAENIADAQLLAKLMFTLANCPKPTIAIVHGAAYGGALGLIACCDIAIASTETTFCFSEARLGIAPAVISPYVIQAIGQRAARRYFLSTETFTAQQAQQMGLIHEIVANENLIQTSEKFIKQLLQNSPEAMKLIKQQLFPPITETQLMGCAQVLADMRASKEGQEGLTAFLEKRAPNWCK